jgi:SpoVK/Ycf46/Vps4 family AAA+-type ATPase
VRRLNLYRIDLAAVQSKYLGETEKELARLFDAAERSDAVLFFDEADDLFGEGRTGEAAVKSDEGTIVIGTRREPPPERLRALALVRWPRRQKS